MFFLSRFFCATRYELVVYGKIVSGDTGASGASVFEHYYFSSGFFPKYVSTYLERVAYENIIEYFVVCSHRQG